MVRSRTGGDLSSVIEDLAIVADQLRISVAAPSIVVGHSASVMAAWAARYLPSSAGPDGGPAPAHDARHLLALRRFRGEHDLPADIVVLLEQHDVMAARPCHARGR